MILTGNFGAEVVDWGCWRCLRAPFPGLCTWGHGPLGHLVEARAPPPHTPREPQHNLPNMVGFRGLRTRPRAPRPSIPSSDT